VPVEICRLVLRLAAENPTGRTEPFTKGHPIQHH
jgi:hypothetical protein